MKRRSARKNGKSQPPKPFKVVVEKHLDGYVAYPLGLKGVVVGEGEYYEAALADVKSAIRFHVETCFTAAKRQANGRRTRRLQAGCRRKPARRAA